MSVSVDTSGQLEVLALHPRSPLLAQVLPVVAGDEEAGLPEVRLEWLGQQGMLTVVRSSAVMNHFSTCVHLLLPPPV